MTDPALTLARTITPTARHPPTTTADPVAVLTRARRDTHGRVTTWPTCSRAGHPSALAQLLDPIDPLNPADDTLPLLAGMRTRLHHARVLAAAVLGHRP